MMSRKNILLVFCLLLIAVVSAVPLVAQDDDGAADGLSRIEQLRNCWSIRQQLRESGTAITLDALPDYCQTPMSDAEAPLSSCGSALMELHSNAESSLNWRNIGQIEACSGLSWFTGGGNIFSALGSQNGLFGARRANRQECRAARQALRASGVPITPENLPEACQFNNIGGDN